MKTFQLDIPNDYSSDEDTQAAIRQYYDGDEEACQNDNGQQLYEELAWQAKKAGLTFVKSTDFGAIWSGTDAQFANCVELLPAWAKRYASKIESRGGHRNGAGRNPTGKAMEMFHIRVPAELKAQLAKVDPEKIRIELSKIAAPE